MASKKILFLSLCLPPLLFGGFIGDTFDKAVGKGVSKVTAGGLDKLQTKAVDWATDGGLAGATNFLFSSDTTSGFWNSIGGTYTTGTVEMCYKRVPQNVGATPDLCSMLGNTSLDACSLLPSTIMGGLYTKKSSSEQASLKAPLKDWCKKTLQSDAKVAANEIKNYMGISGKKASTLTGAQGATGDFLSTANKALNDKAAALSGFLDTNTGGAVKNNESSYAKKNRRLHEAGMGHVANSEIEKIASLNKDITNDQLANMETKVVFSSMEEYKGDLYSKTASDGSVYRQFFNFESHVDIANSQFASLNQQQKSIMDKKSFVDEYIENEQGGLRKQYRTWAEDMARQEIMYTLPKNGEKYYSSFNERNVLNNVGSYSRERDVAISIANHQITKQQYEEKSILLKWRNIADEKADKLKVLLVKNMYASEVFDEATARAQIAQLMAAN